ncbi:Myxococcus cysteine-rich repeat-containing protein [Nannocystis exedens]|uniref:Myxococcus cysteine-rich repeat-containing protein n=1 Tax=Nannocystis exedens TaxID=54 RepID=A0A1I2BDU1_9BACT|nr:DUF4215 domain-containing protein [Nannocystis exedens]PCC68073.1 lipoprotein [Nannocystis exedens]SFE53473.1 Myxococcus cysteine-rich repeat-containing protein [Nannocystis exedens]
MQLTFLSALKTHRQLLLAGALLGATAAACDPKMIGDETSGNVACQEGETKPAEDGCNTCTCHDGGWACTEIACDGLCEEGATKPAEDGCNTCTCHDNSWACTEIACPATEGPTAECGDGALQAPEECDDGNTKDGDGCSAMCAIEGGETEGTSGEPNETEGTDGTSGEPNETEGSSTTSASACGDGVVEGSESCDDGNTASGDGCSSECTIEGGGALSCPDPAPADPYTIADAKIVGDTLVAEIQYSGGCIDHDFALCWDGAFAESDPVQIWTQISHESHDDNCDAWLTVEREFSLADLKATWQAAYQQQSGEITIHLDGWATSLDYVF